MGYEQPVARYGSGKDNPSGTCRNDLRAGGNPKINPTMTRGELTGWRLESLDDLAPDRGNELLCGDGSWTGAQCGRRNQKRDKENG